MKPGWRRRAGVLAVFAALSTALWWEGLVGRAAPFYDMLYVLFYPNCEFFARSIKALDFPFWNPHLYCGVPFMANLQSALFYPFTYLYLLADFPTALSWGLWLHTVLAGVFMYLCARRLRLSRAASIFSGVVFCMNGWFLLRYAYTSNFTSYVWLPLAFFFLLGAWDGDVAAAAAASVCVALQVFAGHPAFVLYGSLALLLLACFEQPRRRLPMTAAVLGLGAVMASVQLVPSLEFALHSVRASGIGFQRAAVASVSPKDFLIMLLGPQWDLYFMPKGGDPHVMGIYFGPIALLAAALALRDKPSRWAPFAAAAAAGAVIALGSYLPLYKELYEHVWPFSWFRFPAQALYMTCFGVSALAGIGFERLSPSRALGALLIALCALDLGLFARRNTLLLPPQVYTEATPIRAALLEKAGIAHVFTSPRTRETYGMPGRSALDAWLRFKEVLHSNLGMAYGFYMADGQEQMRDRRYETVLDAMSSDPLSPWLDVAGVRYVVTLGKMPSKFKPLPGTFAHIYEDPDAFPKAYFAAGSTFVPDDQALAYVAKTGSKPLLSQALVSEPALARPAAPTARAPVAVTAYEPDRVALRLDAPAAGWVVLTDAFSPGWTATVNGTAAPVERVNYFERGVRVPPGPVRIVLRYEPPFFALACALSLSGLLLAWALVRRGNGIL